MPSISSNPVRVAPQQERSTRRLAGFLDAATELFVEVGYEAATMTAVAERFFYRPALQLLSGQTVHRVHAGESVFPGGGGALEAVDGAGGDTDPRGVRRSVHRAHHPIRPERPAYLSLLAAPIRFRRDLLPERASRIAIANAFQAKNPSLSKEQSLLAANVCLHLVRGMMMLYGEADSKGKALVVGEFKKVLTLYLGRCSDSANPRHRANGLATSSLPSWHYF